MVGGGWCLRPCGAGSVRARRGAQGMGARAEAPPTPPARNCLGGNGQRSRHALNADTIREMHRAFREGGRAAINKVMRHQPAVFLKLLVLLVPRELDVTHKGGVKAMTDEQIEAAIEAIRAMLEAKIPGDQAKVIDAIPTVPALPAPNTVPGQAPRRPNEVMDAADTATGQRERKPRKREGGRG
jgi:hypothetical protein